MIDSGDDEKEAEKPEEEGLDHDRELDTATLFWLALIAAIGPVARTAELLRWKIRLPFSERVLRGQGIAFVPIEAPASAVEAPLPLPP